jgi:gluconate kinase
LDSQFEALEAPADALEVDIGATPKEIAAEIKLRLEL